MRSRQVLRSPCRHLPSSPRWSPRRSGALAGRGVGRGDLVAVVMPNTAWWPVIALGIWRAGTALVPLGPRWTLEEAQRALARVRPAMAIPSESLVPLARDALRAAEVGAELVTDGSARGATPLERLLAAAAGDAFAEPGLAPGDLAAVPFSSGTGGLAKGVRLTTDRPA